MVWMARLVSHVKKGVAGVKYVYRVKDWEENFESAKSKGYKGRNQVYMPNKHGLGYRRLIAALGGRGEAMFGAWAAMCQVLSRQRPPREGYLSQDGTMTSQALTAFDISVMTGFSEETVKNMISTCSSPDIEWLEHVPVRASSGSRQGPNKIVARTTPPSHDGEGEGEGNGEGEGEGVVEVDGEGDGDGEVISIWAYALRELIATGKFPALTETAVVSGLRCVTGHEAWSRLAAAAVDELVVRAGSMPGVIGSPVPWIAKNMLAILDGMMGAGAGSKKNRGAAGAPDLGLAATLPVGCSPGKLMEEVE
jgi:hypothetical protein